MSRKTTEYAKTSDNYLAHRHFRVNIYCNLLNDKEASVNVLEVYLDLFDHFAISKKFVFELIDNYVEAGRIIYDDKEKKTIAITEKGLADIKKILGE